MCNWKKWFWPGLLATLLLTALAMMMKSGAIEQDLQVKALNALSAGHKWANVELDGRDLTLTGQAPSEEAIAEALKLSDESYDVRIVASKAGLLPIASPYETGIDKTASEIRLTGSAPSREAADRLAAAVSAAYPGIAVIDELQLARGAQPDHEDLTGFALSNLGSFAEGSARWSDRAYTITGTARDGSSYREALAAISALPASTTLAAADIRAPFIADYVFNAEKTAAGIVLAGHVPDEATRTMLAGEAAKLTTGTVSDQMELGSGAPAGFAECAAFGLTRLGFLSSGSAVTRNGALSVRGTAQSPQDYETVAQSLSGAAPGCGEIQVTDILRSVVSPYVFSATNNGQALIVEGYADSQSAKAAILDRARAANPGLAVIDRLSVAGGIPEGVAWDQATGLALEEAGRLEKGRAAISDKAFSIEGVARSNADYDALAAATGQALPGGLNLASNTVTRPVISPWVWNFENPENGEAVLSGFVPEQTVADDNLAQVASRLGSGVAVANRLEIGNGAPRGFEGAASVAIQSASRLNNGKAEIRDTVLTVTGEALSETAAAEIRTRIANGLPPGFSGKHLITVRKAEDMPILQLDLCQQLLTENLKANSIRFETASAVIAEDSFALLDRLAFVVKRCQTARVEISGHTDSDGAEDYNQALSEERARAVASYLGRAGVDPARLEARGFGETRPVGDNSTSEGKAMNRRIEFVVIR